MAGLECGCIVGAGLITSLKDRPGRGERCKQMFHEFQPGRYTEYIEIAHGNELIRIRQAGYPAAGEPQK